MRMSQSFSPTLREIPSEAETISHQLMLRAGLIRKAAAGIYTYLPLGHRVIRKVAEVVRQEMDAKGGQELQMPVVQPAELWRTTGRWDVYGDEMFRLKDRHEREFCLGPTHEEMVTSLVRDEVTSYRQLPLMLYQIQNKYRDEIRPRFGLMRGREFIMKDLYSFDRDEAGLKDSYAKMYDAYSRIFARCGLTARAVEADSGAIGGSSSHEFMVLAETGEAAIVYCESCSYAANVEKAECQVPAAGASPEAPPAAREVATPGVTSIEDVAAFLGIEPSRLVKTLFYEVEGQLVAVLVRGDHRLNEVKLEKVFAGERFRLAEAEEVRRRLGLPVGFVGPVGLAGKVRVVADRSVPAMCGAVVGANREGYHLVDAVPGRDFSFDAVADMREAVAGDHCPHCQAPLVAARGVEVGHLFMLGTKYSQPLEAIYQDENGETHPMVMGCYGIGIGRTMAAAIEQHHDDDGIIWPMSIAPAHVTVIPVSVRDEQQRKVAEDLYEKLTVAGVETVLDDRDERPGVKFKDADLIGFPLRVTVGPKGLAENAVEVRHRDTGEVKLIPLAEVLDYVSSAVLGRK